MLYLIACWGRGVVAWRDVTVVRVWSGSPAGREQAGGRLAVGRICRSRHERNFLCMKDSKAGFISLSLCRISPDVLVRLLSCVVVRFHLATPLLWFFFPSGRVFFCLFSPVIFFLLVLPLRVPVVILQSSL